jgi:hypothetical protein
LLYGGTTASLEATRRFELLNRVLPSLLAREITITDASKYIGCSRRSLRRYIKQGKYEQTNQIKSLYEQVNIQQKDYSEFCMQGVMDMWESSRRLGR